MDRISLAFKNKKANIGYIVAGYPSLEHSKEFLDLLDESCLDILEVGIPYSDPIADGKVIFEASFKTYQNGIKTDDVFGILKVRKSKKAVVMLVYYNLIFAYGTENFISMCQNSNVSGLIVPDLPFEENKELFELCQSKNIALIPLISVTSSYRIDKILKRANGFIYAVGAIGLTGGVQTPVDRLKELVKTIKSKSSLPVALGFGVRTNKDAKETKSYADGVIMGTSIVELCDKFRGKELVYKLKELFE